MSLGLLLVGMIWGMGFIMVEKSLESGFTTLFINFCRFAVAAVLTLIAFPKVIAKMTIKDVKPSLVSGLFMTLGFFFQVLGQTYTTPGNNALITGSYTVFVPILLALLFRVKPRMTEVIAAVLVFGGIIVLNIPTLSLNNLKAGDFYSVIAAVSFALQFIFLEKAVNDTDPKIVTFIQSSMAAILFLVCFLIFDVRKIPEFNFASGILPVLYLGVLSSFVAYIIQTHAQKVLSPTKVSLIMATEAVFGAIFSLLFGYEELSATFIVGGLLAISGLLVSQIRPKKKEEVGEIKPNGDK